MRVAQYAAHDESLAFGRLSRVDWIWSCAPRLGLRRRRSGLAGSLDAGSDADARLTWRDPTVDWRDSGASPRHSPPMKSLLLCLLLCAPLNAAETLRSVG